MRTVLTTEILVSRVAVFAEMAWMERRPELGLLCRTARDQGNRITVATVQAALPGLPDAGANNVIAWCRMLGLCDARGGITALGEDVAERDEAPVPEQGVYGMWLAQHPVIGRRVLAAERLASTRDQRFDSIGRLDFEPDRGRTFRSVVDPKERFLVRDLPTNHGQSGGIEGQTNARCRLRWTLDFDRERDSWQLDGMIEVPQGGGKYAMRALQHDAESDGLDLWSLAANWAASSFSAFGQWQTDLRRLAVSFQGLSDAEQDRFCKTISLRRVEIPGKGSYDNVSLEDVPIGPASAADAQRWSLSRLDRHLTSSPGYRSRAEIRDLFAELTEGTPLERFEPTLPAHDALLHQASNDSERFWSLAAPVDLSPFPIAADELTSLRIGSPASPTGPEPAGVVRVPYRGGWTMRRLADRLLAGASPARVLLCDRYVRGDDNLAALALLVAALRATNPRVSLEIWTGEDEADFDLIRSITGGTTRGYRQTFGRNLPHDRYLLVKPATGQGFGWHMSNSPLHARADVQGASPETPLRWKDLAASRVNADELEPVLRRWFDGGRR